MKTAKTENLGALKEIVVCLSFHLVLFYQAITLSQFTICILIFCWKGHRAKQGNVSKEIFFPTTSALNGYLSRKYCPNYECTHRTFVLRKYYKLSQKQRSLQVVPTFSWEEKFRYIFTGEKRNWLEIRWTETPFLLETLLGLCYVDLKTHIVGVQSIFFSAKLAAIRPTRRMNQ